MTHTVSIHYFTDFVSFCSSFVTALWHLALGWKYNTVNIATSTIAMYTIRYSEGNSH